jgi:hypothetical protein
MYTIVENDSDADGILSYNAITYQNGLAQSYRNAGIPIVFKEDLLEAIQGSYVAPLSFNAGDVNISIGQNPDGTFQYKSFRGNLTNEWGVYASNGKLVQSVNCFNFMAELRATGFTKVTSVSTTPGGVTNIFVNAGNNNGNNNGNHYADTTARLASANYHPPVPPNPQIVYLMPPPVTPPAPPPVTPVEPTCDKCPKKNWKYVVGAGAVAGAWILTEILDGNNQVGSIPGYANPSGYPFNNGSTGTGTGTNTGGSTGTNGPWTNTSGGSGGGYVLNGVYYPQ